MEPGPFVFVSGRPSLDLAGTLKWRDHDLIDQIPTPDLAARWTRSAGLVDRSPAVDDHGLAELHNLREAGYRLAIAAVEQRMYSSTDVRLVNAMAQRQPVTVRLRPAGQLSRLGDLPAILSTLARDIVDLIGSDDVGRVRQCAGPGCTRLFIDTSRAVPRRWCGMAECGNRVKAAAYRRRRRTSSAES